MGVFFVSPYRHQAHIELAFLPGAKLQRIPKGVRFSLGPIAYESTYVLKGKRLTAQGLAPKSRR